MNRCPVLLHLTVALVALFGDDVEGVTRCRPDAGGIPSVAAIDLDSPTPLVAIRLADSHGPLSEVTRSGRLTRDLTVRLCSESPTRLSMPGLVVAANLRQTPPAASSLVIRHTRLQI